LGRRVAAWQALQPGPPGGTRAEGAGERAAAEAARLERDIAVDLEVGARLCEEAARRAEAAASPADARALEGWARRLRGAATGGGTRRVWKREPAPPAAQGDGAGQADASDGEAARGPEASGANGSASAAAAASALLERARLAADGGLGDLLLRHADRSHAAAHAALPLWVDPARARASAWYEFFPRSLGQGRHGTLQDAARHLEHVAAMGFDTVYLPPIHPIGRTKRKGPNNDPQGKPGDVGSPWAIGAAEGGHKAVHPELGTVEDVEALVRRARGLGLEVALDVAFQCSPDHPYVQEHPDWFRRLPDGTVRHAENPPKRYEDIVPFDFTCEDWPSLWAELRDVVLFWADRGVRTFRVDNPHTKPFAFWEWLIAQVRAKHPDTLFLSEAFTRPKVMHRLAKLGFTHSYTYFTWRTTKQELTEYAMELTRGPGRDYFRPHFWPNTPDILPHHLQTGGRAAFVQRLVLAATLSANYGIYGPAFELCVHEPMAPGKEEYLDSEKYELRDWSRGSDASIAPIVARLNAARRAHPALLQDATLTFHTVHNDRILAYSKRSPDGTDTVLTFVNLDPHATQAAMTDLDLDALGLDPARPFEVEDLLTGHRYTWSGRANYVELDPVHRMPAHVFAVHQDGPRPAKAQGGGPLAHAGGHGHGGAA
ncbi:MAG TPA: alpha-amylase family glycosyl hydrolase, partial [Candidatus Thermoplasmatota archaeon]|nr:alpha-amylase family glycosyl hydrolase [Candidatus Thermoplasmatota archaeon]